MKADFVGGVFAALFALTFVTMIVQANKMAGYECTERDTKTAECITYHKEVK